MPWTKNVTERDQAGTKRVITFDLDYSSETIIRSRRKWQETLPIAEISELALDRFSGSITAKTSRGDIVWSFSGQTGRTFFDDIKRLMTSEEPAIGVENQASESGPQTGGTIPQSGDLSGQLTQLAALHKAGSLSDEEFQTAKSKLLGT